MEKIQSKIFQQEKLPVFITVRDTFELQLIR